jgi:hypothetical protein
MDDEEVRWELGERIYRDSWAVPGLFIFVYAGVIGWKHLKRGMVRAWLRYRPEARLQLPPPWKALPPPDYAERLPPGL